MGDKILIGLIYILIFSAVTRHVARTIGFIVDLSRSLHQPRSFR